MAVPCWLSLALAVSALYTSQYISEVPYHGLRSAIEDTNFLTLSIVYDPDGEKSKKLEPIIQKTAETYQHLIRTKAINCYSDKEKCTPETRDNLPGVMVSYYAGIDPVSKEKKVFQETFLGALTVKGLGEFILNHMPFFGTELTYRNIKWFLNQPDLKKVLLFSDRDAVPSLYKAVTSAFRGRLDFGIVWKNQTELVEQYGVKWFPTLLVLSAEKNIEYDGDLNFPELHDFLAPHTSPLHSDRFVLSTPIETEPATQLSLSTYHSAFASIPRPAVIYFYAAKPEPDWEQFKVTYRGVVDCYELNLDQEDTADLFLEQENIPDLPHIKAQFTATSKPRSVSIAALPELLRENIPYELLRVDVDVPKTFLENMKSLEMLGAIFVTEDDVPVQFRALTKDHFLKDRILFGVYRNDTVAKFQDLFKLSRVPSLMATYCVRGEEVEFREFSGDLFNSVQMRYFLEELMLPMFYNASALSVESWKDEEVEELTAKQFAQSCTKRASFCLIALMEGQPSGLFKSKLNREALTALKKAQVYAEAKSRPVRVSYLDGECEFEIRKALGVKEKDLPAFVAYQGVKNLGFVLGEEATETNIRLFIDRLTYDREKGQTVELLPADRDCKFFRTQLAKLTKENPEATRKELLQMYTDSEKELQAQGKLPKKGRKKSDL